MQDFTILHLFNGVIALPQATLNTLHTRVINFAQGVRNPIGDPDSSKCASVFITLG